MTLREHDDTPRDDGIVLLHDVAWEDYERLLEIRGEGSVPRISYLDGEVEMVRPSKEHERIKSHIGRLLEHWCIDRNIDVSPFGSWTVKKKAKRCGFEADECYIFGKEHRDRPHLAIEVEWTLRYIDTLEIYRKLGVEEVWYWRKGVIEIYALDRVPRSRLLPDLDVELLASMVDRDSLTQAVRDFRKATGTLQI